MKDDLWLVDADTVKKIKECLQLGFDNTVELSNMSSRPRTVELLDKESDDILSLIESFNELKKIK